jgi:hypothetical protein
MAACRGTFGLFSETLFKDGTNMRILTLRWLHLTYYEKPNRKLVNSAAQIGRSF